MNGYGSHTYSFWNDNGERFWVKFHFKTQQGHKFYTNAEAETLIGKSRETYQEELFGGIERGEFPKWTVQVQIMTEAQARADFLQSVRPDEGLAAWRVPADRDWCHGA